MNTERNKKSSALCNNTYITMGKGCAYNAGNTGNTDLSPVFHKDPLEEEMATHSSLLAWKIPRTEQPGRLQVMGSQGVTHSQETSLLMNQAACHFLKKQKVRLYQYLLF